MEQATHVSSTSAMFGDAGELWFPVDHATRLRDQPKQVHLAGQAIALFRDSRRTGPG